MVPDLSPKNRKTEKMIDTFILFLVMPKSYYLCRDCPFTYNTDIYPPSIFSA